MISMQGARVVMAALDRLMLAVHKDGQRDAGKAPGDQSPEVQFARATVEAAVLRMLLEADRVAGMERTEADGLPLPPGIEVRCLDTNKGRVCLWAKGHASVHSDGIASWP
jgi:hypothetical protein